MMNSLLSEDITIEKGSTSNNSISCNSSSSLPVICDNYTLPTTRDTFESFLVSVQQSDPPSHWYHISHNNASSLCKLLSVEECISSSIIKTCGLIRFQLLRGNMTMNILKDK